MTDHQLWHNLCVFFVFISFGIRCLVAIHTLLRGKQAVRPYDDPFTGVIATLAGLALFGWMTYCAVTP